MNPSLQHPLDTIYSNNSLLLLEAMIPYLDSSFQLPIALLIKLQEMRTIIHFFHNPSQLEAYGFNRKNCGNEDLISMLCQTMGVNIPEQMANMQTMMNLANSMPTYASSDSSMLSHGASESCDTSMSRSRDDMIDAIRQILSEQEGDFHESESIT